MQNQVECYQIALGASIRRKVKGKGEQVRGRRWKAEGESEKIADRPNRAQDGDGRTGIWPVRSVGASLVGALVAGAEFMARMPIAWPEA